MPLHISDSQYGHAVLESVQSGSYPVSEEVVASELPSSALPTVLKLVDQAREDVKRTIRKISRESAPDIDGWVLQAKHLRARIGDSQKLVQDIVKQATQGEQLQSRANDAARTLDFLKGEINFSWTLVKTLESIGCVQQTLGISQNSIYNDNFEEAVDLLRKAEEELITIRSISNTVAVGLLQTSINGFRLAVLKTLEECWHVLLKTDHMKSKISIKHHIQRSTLVTLGTVIETLSKLHMLKDYISALYKDIDEIILSPRLNIKDRRAVSALHVQQNEITMIGQLADLSTKKLFADMKLTVEFFHDHLPSSISNPLAELLIPGLVSRLISDWLSISLPIDTKGIPGFEEVLVLVVDFGDTLELYGWPGKGELIAWVNKIPQIWIDNRREISLDQIRKLLAGGLGKSETVERIETQVLLSRDDEWNASWSDNERDDNSENLTLPDARDPQSKNQEEDDVSAWGLDTDDNDESLEENLEGLDVEHEDADAWGWGDETENIETSHPIEATNTKINGRPEAPDQAARKITLKETYNITTLPKAIFQIITQIISDAETLKSPGNMSSSIVSAAPQLFSLPGSVLSMYRASAQVYYSTNQSGSMFLYNDSMWLAESLRQFTGIQSKKTGQINPGAAETEISALESFAKRTYGKEMESQRTIIRDLLDGAQGFASCTEPPYAQECDIAISSTVDRLRDVHRQWSEVLSHSALLQSLGSLLSTVVNKIIVDVEDMSDISEPESQRLAAFCSRIAALDDLFTPAPPPNAVAETNVVPLTAVYTPSWLKFQYLANILEGSLVDIKYLWAEGELRLEFEVEELVDLIEALFADSEHRRKAIAEIRRS